MSIKIIGISGKAESGKTTFGQMLKKSFEKDNFKVLEINYADVLKYIAKQYYNWNGIKDENGRSLLQKLGTEVGRNKIDKDIWVRLVDLFINLMKDDFDAFIIGDCRFPNEIEYWKNNNNFFSIRIMREGHKSKLTEEQKKHESEVALDNFTNFDFIINNNGSLKKLQQWADGVANNILSKSCN